MADWRPFWIWKMWDGINCPHFMSYLNWKCFKWSEIDIKAKEHVKVTIWIICREVRFKMADWRPFECFKNGVDVKQLLPIFEGVRASDHFLFFIESRHAQLHADVFGFLISRFLTEKLAIFWGKKIKTQNFTMFGFISHVIFIRLSLKFAQMWNVIPSN